MRVLLFRGICGRRRLKQKRAWPTTTSCVVGHWCRFRAGGRQRSALRIRPRSEWAYIQGDEGDTVWRPRGIRGPSDEEKTGLHEKGSHRMLESGDRTVGVGEGGLEMGENVRRRRSARFRRQLGRRTSRRQCGADLTLALVELFPDALQGSVTQMTFGDSNRGGDAVGDGALEESPQRVGCQASPSDFVGGPDAEGPPAAAPPIATAAKDPPCADRFSLGAAVVKSVQTAVPNERANDLAVRTGRVFEPLSNRVPFFIATAKPPRLAHGPRSPKATIVQARGKSGVRLKILKRGAG